jgi:hypothetical protein
MPNYTTNYNLKKPTREDFYDVEDFNQNADIIDGELKNVNDKTNNHMDNTTNPHNVTPNQVGAVALDGSNEMTGELKTPGVIMGQARIKYNVTDDCIDFVFV